MHIVLNWHVMKLQRIPRDLFWWPDYSNFVLISTCNKSYDRSIWNSAKCIKSHNWIAAFYDLTIKLKIEPLKQRSSMTVILKCEKY